LTLATQATDCIGTIFQASQISLGLAENWLFLFMAVFGMGTTALAVHALLKPGTPIGLLKSSEIAKEMPSIKRYSTHQAGAA